MTAIVTKLDTQQAIEREIDRDPAISSANSKSAYKSDLRQFNEWRSGRRMTKTLVGEYASELMANGLKVKTVNRKLTAIRWWSRRLAELAHEDMNMTDEDKQDLITMAERVTSVRNVKGDDSKVGRHLGSDELEQVILTCQADGTSHGIRDAAMFAVLRVCGLRRSELLGLDLEDLTGAGSDDDPEFEIVVRGKGNKIRTLIVNNGAALHLRDWLQLRGDVDGPVFCPIDRWSQEIHAGESLSSNSFNKTKNKRIKESGVRDFVLHDWRRTWIGDLLDRDVDLVTVSDLAGHVDPKQTARYDRRPEEAKREAVRGLFVPYRRKES